MRSANSRVFLAPLTVAVFALTAAGSFTGEPRVGYQAVHPDSAAVAAVVNGFSKALSVGDSLGALALLAKDVVILESGGAETRADYRSHHLAGDIAFMKGVKTERGPLLITIDGNTAWTTSTSVTMGDFKGRQINSIGAESMVLTRSKNGWQIRSIHWSSRVKKSAS